MKQSVGLHVRWHFLADLLDVVQYLVQALEVTVWEVCCGSIIINYLSVSV